MYCDLEIDMSVLFGEYLLYVKSGFVNVSFLLISLHITRVPHKRIGVQNVINFFVLFIVCFLKQYKILFENENVSFIIFE